MRTKLTSKTEQLRQIILDDIKSGVYQEDQSLPTEHEFCETYGISRSTIREAISSLVNDNCLTRIPGRGTFLNKGARDVIAEQERKSICLVGVEREINYGNDLFFATLLLGMHDILDELPKDMKVLMIPQGLDIGTYLKQENMDFEELRCDGVICGGYEMTKSDAMLLDRYQLKCVSIGRQTTCPNVPYVDTDHELGAYLAVKHLTDLGHQHIAVIERNHFQSAYDNRQIGYRKAFAEASIELDRKWCFPIPDLCSIEDVLEDVLSNIPDLTAFIVYAKISSRLVLELQKRGKQVPRDVSIIEYMGGRNATEIHFTEIRQSLRSLASLSTQALIDALAGKPNDAKPIILEPKLIQGESTAPARI